MEIFVMISIVCQIITVAIMGIINALLSYFLDYCFWPNSIFKKWLPFLCKTICRIKFKETYLRAIQMPIQNANEVMQQECQNVFLYKILGGCVVCMNIWLGFITWMFIYFNTDIFNPYCIIVYLMVSSALIRKLVGATY